MPCLRCLAGITHVCHDRVPFADLLTVQTQPSGVVHQLVLIVVQPAYIRGALARAEQHLGGKGGEGVEGEGGTVTHSRVGVH